MQQHLVCFLLRIGDPFVRLHEWRQWRRAKTKRKVFRQKNNPAGSKPTGKKAKRKNYPQTTIDLQILDLIFSDHPIRYRRMGFGTRTSVYLISPRGIYMLNNKQEWFSYSKALRVSLWLLLMPLGWNVFKGIFNTIHLCYRIESSHITCTDHIA